MDARAPPPHGLFGLPPPRLVAFSESARQFSPLRPGAESLETVAAASLAGMTMLAAPGTLERQHDLAAMLTALAPNAPFTVLAPKDMGGARLGRELATFGCAVEERAKAHHRICGGVRPVTLDAAALHAARDAGAPRRLDGSGLWSQPGVFSWDRLDPGTALLVETLPGLSGRGADFGCGLGLLAHAVLATPKVTRLDMIDIDRRAIAAARRNVDDPRVHLHWADIRTHVGLSDLDFVVTNPPFHDGGTEDRDLGQVFVQKAAAALRRGGRVWLVANRHLPFEAGMDRLFRTMSLRHEANGYKVIEAVK